MNPYVIQIMLLYLVHVRCVVFKKESATPDDAKSTSVRAVLHPDASSISPRTLHSDCELANF